MKIQSFWRRFARASLAEISESGWKEESSSTHLAPPGKILDFKNTCK